MLDENFLLETISGMLQSQELLVKRIDELEKSNHELMRRSEIVRRLVENMPYELKDERFQYDYVYPVFESLEQTVYNIREKRMSLSRFGDGEFSIMRGKSRHSFQEYNKELSDRLYRVFKSDLPDLIIGVADNFGNLDRFTDEGAHGIRMFMSSEMRMFLDGILDKERIYADGYITRFYALMKDNIGEGPAYRLNLLKSMWENRDVIIVEGSETRMGVGNDLLDNSNLVHRILAPAVDSFKRYDDILQECLKIEDKQVLFLIALGPAAGVLAYDLCANGFQAVDVGHIDLEYEWYLRGEGKRVSVPGKYNNEVADGNIVEDINDPVYNKQIIAEFV